MYKEYRNTSLSRNYTFGRMNSIRIDFISGHCLGKKRNKRRPNFWVK